jgi:formiminotetrahydrofolate cyclodeaminase
LFQNLNVRFNTVRFVLSESLTLSNGQLMSTLAGAACAFVAILAGFYTTKIFSISTDKNRLKNEIDSLSLKLQHKREIPKKYEKLIISLRTAYAKELSLDKDETTYDDLLDALRLALKGFDFR